MSRDRARRIRDEDRTCYVCAKRLMTSHGTFHGTAYYTYPKAKDNNISKARWSITLHVECADLLGQHEEAGDGV